MKLSVPLTFAALALAPLPAIAHHGWSGQDSTKVTTLEGRIDAVSYSNPHGSLQLSQGNQKWTVTLAPVSRMSTRGVTEDKLKVGQVVKVSGHRNLDMSRNELKANDITIAGVTTNLR